MEMIIAGLMLGSFFVGYIIGLKKNSSVKRDKWSLLNYHYYMDTSFGDKAPSCRFTVVNETTKEVFNRMSYGKLYSQREIIHAIHQGVAHKLGTKDTLV